jgi:hypothetical protein
MRWLRLSALSIFALLSIGSALAVGVSQPVHAQLFDEVCQNTPNATVCQEKNKNQSKQDNVIYGKNGVLIKAANILALMVGIAAVLVIAVSGIRYIFSAGDSNSISTAKKGIIYSLVGLVIALVARSIIAFVINRL